MIYTFFFFLWPHLRHMEVPGLGVELELPFRPMPQTQEQQIWAVSVTYSATCGYAKSLTYWVRPGIEPTCSQRQHQVLNLLSHGRNSLILDILFYQFLLWPLSMELYFIVFLIFIPLMTNEVENFFHVLLGSPHSYLLKRNIYSNLPLIFKLDWSLFLLLSFRNF